MPDKQHGGARAGAGRTRVRWRVSKEAAKRLDSELAWATEDVQDAILSEIILRAPRDLFRAAAECVAEMGDAEKIAGPEEKPIIL
jgi:hypothetical protein